ncbi:hypothetical protein CR513_27215, partial [Mucuna pruriens]
VVIEWINLLFSSYHITNYQNFLLKRLVCVLKRHEFLNKFFPIFDVENYDIWTVKMEASIEALDFWEAVEEDYDVLSLPNNLTITHIRSHKEKKNKKGKGKGITSQIIFTRITTLKSAKTILDYLRKEYIGD